jgi:hypothetical protein
LLVAVVAQGIDHSVGLQKGGDVLCGKESQEAFLPIKISSLSKTALQSNKYFHRSVIFFVKRVDPIAASKRAQATLRCLGKQGQH